MGRLWPRLDRLDERILHHILAIDDHAHHARTGAKQFSQALQRAQHSIVADNGRAANDGQLGTTLACAALEGLESPNLCQRGWTVISRGLNDMAKAVVLQAQRR